MVEVIFRAVKFKVFIRKAQVLQGGVKSIRSSDLWQIKDNRFYTWEEAKIKFNMLEGEQGICQRIVENIPMVWTRELISPTTQTKSG
jgi:hypothetical protein